MCSQETEIVSLSGYRKLPEADVALFGFLSFWVACDPYVFLFYVPMSLCPYKAPACKSVFCSYVFKMTKEECVPMSLCPYNTLVCKSVFLFLCLKKHLHKNTSSCLLYLLVNPLFFSLYVLKSLLRSQINKNFSKKKSKQYCYSRKSFKFAIYTNSEGSV